jgi:hypothetical protein
MNTLESRKQLLLAEKGIKNWPAHSEHPAARLVHLPMPLTL